MGAACGLPGMPGAGEQVRLGLGVQARSPSTEDWDEPLVALGANTRGWRLAARPHRHQRLAAPVARDDAPGSLVDDDGLHVAEAANARPDISAVLLQLRFAA